MNGGVLGSPLSTTGQLRAPLCLSGGLANGQRCRHLCQAKKVELFPACGMKLEPEEEDGEPGRKAKSEHDTAIAVGKKNDLSLQQGLSGRKGRQCGCMEAVRVIRRSFPTNATPDTTPLTLQRNHPLRTQVVGSIGNNQNHLESSMESFEGLTKSIKTASIKSCIDPPFKNRFNYWELTELA